MSEKQIPVLTEIVTLPATDLPPRATLTDDEMAELQARIASRSYELVERLLHESLRELETNLLADVIGHLRTELPDLIDDALREHLADRPDRS
jgi:hypothetical protein